MDKRTKSPAKSLPEQAKAGGRSSRVKEPEIKNSQKTEDQFRTIFDSVNDAIFIHDLETGAIVDVNRKMCEMYGCSREEAFRLSAADACSGKPPCTEQDALNWLRKAAAGEPQIFEWHAKHKTGRLFWVEVNIKRATIGAKDRLLVTVRDISERKRAQERLEEYEKAVEGSQDMIAAVDCDYRYRLANAAFVNYRHTSKEQVIGRTVAEILGQELFEKVVRKNLERAFCGEIVNYTMRQVYPGLGERELRVSYLPIHGANGIDRVTTIIRDMTERKKMEERLKDTMEQLRSLSHRLLEVQEKERRYIARELHDEMGQILTALRISLKRAERVKDSTLDEIKESIHMVDGLIGRVRNLSVELRPQVLDDFGLIPAVDWYVKWLSVKAGLKIVFNPDFPETRFSPLIELTCFRIVQEALTNVVRHSGAKTVHVDLGAHDGGLLLTIADDGNGFSADGTSKRGSKSRSFGLLGMQERATLAGGRLELKSRSGRGTVVKAWFPSESITEEGF